MAHKALKGRKKPERSGSIRSKVKKVARQKEVSRQAKKQSKLKKAAEAEAKEAKEAKAAAAASKQPKVEVPAAAAPVAAPAPAPAVPAPAPPLSKKDKRKARMQAALEDQHRSLYSTGGRVLLVGEGNFSFARALCRGLEGKAEVFATAFDGESVLGKKYPDAAECRAEVERLGGTALVGVDATRLHEVREFRSAFRVIAWNFPHIGGGESDVAKSVADHQKLLAGFFASALRCLDDSPGAAVHVAVKKGEPYKSWKVVQTARAACPELDLRTAVPFATSAWLGYEHRRTQGFDERFSKRESEELAAGAKVYVFCRRQAQA